MYNANGTEREDDAYGSTNLHMDLTDVVNIMVWAAACSDGSPGYALWHIFPPWASNIIQQFLWEEGFRGPGDSIHSQGFYLNDARRDRLAAKYNIHPYTIRQYKNEAVFIPAKCAHQVRCNP
jgi:hypothetical protein